MKKLTLFFFVFRLSCLGFFFYEAWNSFEDYSEKRTLSDIGFIKQDRYPLPMICITTEKKKFLYDKNINITYEDYLNGNWKINNQSEKKLWDLVSPRLPNLIKKIVLWKTLKIDSDQYSKIKISVDKLPGFGVDIEQMDYHSLPKIFCLSFREGLRNKIKKSMEFSILF